MTSLIDLFIFLLFVLIALIFGYAMGYILMLLKQYRQLKEDIKRAEEDLFLIKELLKELKDQTKCDYKIIQQKEKQ